METWELKAADVKCLCEVIGTLKIWEQYVVKLLIYFSQNDRDHFKKHEYI